MNEIQIKLTKLDELPDAIHQNNIETGYTVTGPFYGKPEVGKCFWVGGWFRTSFVKEIIDENTFKTCNSIYRWEEVKR